MKQDTSRHPCARAYLQQRLDEYVAKSAARISLRTLSKKLGVSASFLSQVLRDQRRASPQMMLRMGQALELSSLQIDYLCLLAQRDLSPSAELRASYERRLDEMMAPLDESNHHAKSKGLRDWFQFAILALAEGSDKLTAESVARRLGIAPLSADLAIARLLRTGHLRRSADGLRPNVDGDRRVDDRSNSEKPLLRQFFELGRWAMTLSDAKEQYAASQTFSFDQDRMAEVEELVTWFLQRMQSLSSKGRGADVFQLNLHFFSLSNGQLKPTLTLKSEVGEGVKAPRPAYAAEGESPIESQEN